MTTSGHNCRLLVQWFQKNMNTRHLQNKNMTVLWKNRITATAYWPTTPLRYEPSKKLPTIIRRSKRQQSILKYTKIITYIKKGTIRMGYHHTNTVFWFTNRKHCATVDEICWKNLDLHLEAFLNVQFNSALKNKTEKQAWWYVPVIPTL